MFYFQTTFINTDKHTIFIHDLTIIKRLPSAYTHLLDVEKLIISNHYKIKGL
jgi:hypothetical protein